MRPMTSREALAIEHRNEDWIAAHPDEWEQATRILDALVEWREASLAYADSQRTARRVDTYPAWQEVDARKSALHAAETKLAALERGEEAKE